MTRIVHVDPHHPNPSVIADAAAVWRRGGLVAFPTETVYGLGANALDAAAVARIFEAKGRPSTDPMIVHIADARDLRTVAVDVPALAMACAAAFWPGALTLILQRHRDVPASVSAGLSTIGVRVPSHPVAQALLQRAGLPIAAPSANRFSRPSPTCAEHVRVDLDGVIDVIVDAGSTTIGVESTILDLTVTPAVIRRPGGIPLDAIQRIVPEVRMSHQSVDIAQPQPSPGQLLRHYAPRARLTLYLGSVDAVAHRLAADARSQAASGSRVGVLAPAEDLLALAPRLAAAAGGGRIMTRRYGSRADHDEAARELFAALRELDGEAVDVILAAGTGHAGIGAAIVDRLTRAAEGRVILANG
ncbi:MAG TPA: L-threonylcarbamoyladenylate synthase [Vicinamibacterales bacterium]|nr:L-threonylcarbamoyladenylate synthase [Vicinamibacterales bacterium]